MRREQKLKALLLTSSVSMLVTTPAWSQIVKTQGVQQSSSDQRLPLLSKAELVEPIREIRHLSEIEHPSKSARMLVQSSTPPNPPSVLPSQGGKQGGGVVQVTGVKANPTDKGVEVILQTTKGQALQLVNRSTGNTFIAEIPNAQLRLPSGEGFTFRSQKPIAGVTEITVTNFDAKTIRVTVTGEAGAPQVELYDSPNEGLIFSVASTAPSAQNPTQPSPNLAEGQREGSQTPQNPAQPENQTQPTRPSASGDEPIELVVTGQQDGYRVPDATTATKTDTPIRDIPASIQVVPRQVLEDQKAINLIDALRNISGVSLGATGGLTSFPNQFTIRGFSTSNNNGSNYVNGIRIRGRTFSETANIEQVEVLKGPASVLYGQAEPGGIINTTTKQPID